MSLLTRMVPILSWAPTYERSNLRSDLFAGVTVGAMLVPQAMAYALLAGLPPEVGLYAATIPVVIYAVLGTSRQLAVGPVAIVSMLAGSGLAPIAEEGTAAYLGAAALLALLVGLIHIGVGVVRLGALVNFLSHPVLVGFTAAAGLIIGFSQVKHILGISVARQEHFHATVLEVVSAMPSTNLATLAVGITALAVLVGLKRLLPTVPGALLVVIGSTAAVELLDLQQHGVGVVGSIPDTLPSLVVPSFDRAIVGPLLSTAVVITLVGFMESVAVAKVYARRHRYELDPNSELVALGAANMMAGLFGGYPVTGGFSRTAVNDTAGAKTPLASLVTAGVVMVTIAFFTPLLGSLPNAALGAIIIVAVLGLIDWGEMRHIAVVKPSDLISVGAAFVATLALGIEIGIGVAAVVSLFVVFARISAPHSAVLGQVERSTAYRNIKRFPEAETLDGLLVVRIDAGISFVNSANIKRLLLERAAELSTERRSILLDASGVNDIDSTGVEMLHEVMGKLEEDGVDLYLSEVKGPVRDVLRRARIWSTLGNRVFLSTHDAVSAIKERDAGQSEPNPTRSNVNGGQAPAADPAADPEGESTMAGV